ncbi:MAG: hypothetical protein R3301_03180 [Saprospiraceae bacterium]|nr:hypothetical protein [Saprospiraceae bacterium]
MNAQIEFVKRNTICLTYKSIIIMRPNRMLSFGMLFLLMFVMSACSDSQSKEEQAKEELVEAADAVSEMIAAEREKLVKDLEAMRAKVNGEIEEMRKQLSEAKAEAESSLSEEMQALSKKGEQLNAYLDEVAEVSESSWEEWKQKAENMIRDLEKEIQRIEEDTM